MLEHVFIIYWLKVTAQDGIESKAMKLRYLKGVAQLQCTGLMMNVV